jgi:hypothetical protein
MNEIKNHRLSIDNLLLTTYALWMRINICQENGIQKRPWKMHFGMPRLMDGVSKLVADMPGAGFTAPTTTMNVVAESSVFQAFGVHQSIRQITASKYGGLSITALPAKTTKSGSAT